MTCSDCPEATEEDIATHWLEGMLGKDRGRIPFGEWLKDGELLFQVALKIKPEVVHRTADENPKARQKDNIEIFLRVCRIVLHSDEDLFTIGDLSEGKHLEKVSHSICKMSLAMGDELPLSSELCTLTTGTSRGMGPSTTGATKCGDMDTIATGDLETDVISWLETVSGERKPADEYFAEWLHDGQVLCKVANKLTPGIIRKINKSELPFKQRENISSFIKACRQMGVPVEEQFATDDLVEQADVLKVMRTIFWLGKLARETCPKFKGPYLGARPKARS